MQKKEELRFEDFLAMVPPVSRDFAARIDEKLLQDGCKRKITAAKSGYLVSYTYSKKVLLNFVFRKAGLVGRLYGDNVVRYLDFLQTLPEKMLKAVEKAPECRRLIDPEKCNARCAMGYDFVLGDKRQQKCRYSCFMFLADEGNTPYIEEFLYNELGQRSA